MTLQSSRGKQKGGGASTSAESSSVASLFKQSSQSDPFAVWCEDQLKRLQAVKNIDSECLRAANSDPKTKNLVTLITKGVRRIAIIG